MLLYTADNLKQKLLLKKAQLTRMGASRRWGVVLALTGLVSLLYILLSASISMRPSPIMFNIVLSEGTTRVESHDYTKTPIFHTQPASKLIHFPVRNKQNIPEENKIIMEKWRKLNPEFQVVLYDDDDMRKFIAQSYPEFLGLFDHVTESVERVDIWRYLIVHAKGGVYADSDWEPRVPISEWPVKLAAKLGNLYFNRAEFQSNIDNMVIVGFEDVDSKYNKKQFLQWGFYSAKPGHPIFYKTVEHIADFYVDELLTLTYRGYAVYRTGPEPFTWAILRHLQQRGANLTTLDRTKPFHYKEFLAADWFDLRGHVDMKERQPLAYHYFLGSWKWEREFKKETVDQELSSDKEKVAFMKYQERNRKVFENRYKAYWNGELPPI